MIKILLALGWIVAIIAPGGILLIPIMAKLTKTHGPLLRFHKTPTFSEVT